jgi:hypothetical protein
VRPDRDERVEIRVIAALDREATSMTRLVYVGVSVALARLLAVFGSNWSA